MPDDFLAMGADSMFFQYSPNSAYSILQNVLVACIVVGCKPDCFPHAVSMFLVFHIALRDTVVCFCCCCSGALQSLSVWQKPTELSAIDLFL
jgi:hypothetical protein